MIKTMTFEHFDFNSISASISFSVTYIDTSNTVSGKVKPVDTFFNNSSVRIFGSIVP